MLTANVHASRHWEMGTQRQGNMPYELIVKEGCEPGFCHGDLINHEKVIRNLSTCRVTECHA